MAGLTKRSKSSENRKLTSVLPIASGGEMKTTYATTTIGSDQSTPDCVYVDELVYENRGAMNWVTGAAAKVNRMSF